MEAKGYPVGWTRVPGTPRVIIPAGDDYEAVMERGWQFYAIQEMAICLGLGPSRAIVPGSYEYCKAASEFEKNTFTEQDKAWYCPFPGLGL